MVTRRFGRTGLQMPVLSCGGMRYQDGWKDKPLDEIPSEIQENLEATIHRAIECGINHIETARGYGPSERQLGLVLPRLDRDRTIIQTKIGPNEDPAVFTEQFHESLERLRIDRVDLLAIHGINDAATLEMSVKPGGCFDACQKIREAGLARFIGFSTHGPTDVICRAIAHGQAETGAGFDYVNLHWYYIFQRNWPAIELATQRDMGVFIISPSDKGGMLYKPSPKLTGLTQPLHPMTFNDLFCLARPEVHTLSIGAARPSDFDEHLDTLEYLDRAGEVVAPIAEQMASAWRSVTPEPILDPYHADLPEHHRTPGEINIPVILWLLQLARAYDMVEYGKMRYNLLGNGGHWFPGQPAAPLDEDGVEAALRQTVADHPLGADRVVAMLREAHELLKGEEKKRLTEDA